MPSKPAASAAMAPARTSLHRAPNGSKRRSISTTSSFAMHDERRDAFGPIVGVVIDEHRVARIAHRRELPNARDCRVAIPQDPRWLGATQTGALIHRVTAQHE